MFGTGCDCCKSFEISALQMLHFTRTEATELLEVYKDVVPYYSKMVDHLVSAPCIALEGGSLKYRAALNQLTESSN